MIAVPVAAQIVAPARRTRARQLLLAAALFASLVLGGVGLTADPSAQLMPSDDGTGSYCPGQVNEAGDCIITGTNTGN